MVQRLKNCQMLACVFSDGANVFLGVQRRSAEEEADAAMWHLAQLTGHAATQRVKPHCGGRLDPAGSVLHDSSTGS